MSNASWADEPRAQPIRVYSHLLNPAEHPDYTRRAVKPPTWETFGNQTQFIVLRGLTGDIPQLRKLLDKATVEHDLGRVVWPDYGVLFTKNLNEIADELRKRNLFLFDVWGYVPAGADGFWSQFQVPRNAMDLLVNKLGDHWLGTDIGEQDSRFIVSFSDQIWPLPSSRFDNYLNFQRHFEFMGNELGNRHAALLGMTYGHYLLKEGTYTMLGAECVQGHMNPQVFYSFIRGAGKQNGVPWFGNISVYSPAGDKQYAGTKDKPIGTHHLAGTSLSLMKRLMYSQIFYNCMLVGFENGWFWSDYSLTPVGRIQQFANRWVREHGSPGVQHAGVALLLDFEQGWRVPTIQYRQPFTVWSRVPYDERDFLTDNILNMFYPNYADSFALADETSYSTATPYGDMLDCLLTDAPPWLLDRYGVIVMVGKSRDPELIEKLTRYVRGGGHLVLVGEKWIPESGAGRVTVLPGTGLEEISAETKEALRVGRLAGVRDKDSHFQTCRPLTPATRTILDGVFKSQRLFEVGDNLGFITCRKRAGEYTLAILNNTWGELPFKIQSHCGPIESVQEMILDSEERKAAEFLPRVKQVQPTSLGVNSATTIAGGDVRIFSVRVREAGVIEAPHEIPAARPKQINLALTNIVSIKEEVLRRPTFFQHFGGVVVESDYLRDREMATLERQGGWIKRQGMNVIVKLTGPRLDDKQDPDAEVKELDTLFKKMNVLGGRHLMVPLAGDKNVVPVLKSLAASATKYVITLDLIFDKSNMPADLFALVKSVDGGNVKLIAPLENAGKPFNSAVGMLTVRPDQLSELPANLNIPVVLTAADATDTAANVSGGIVLPIRIAETSVPEIPNMAPNSTRQRVILSLRNPASIEREILRRLTFTQHCEGVMVDWDYLRDRESEALERDGTWLKQRNIKVFVDLTPGLNFYPDLRLVNNSKQYFDASVQSIADVMRKMALLGSQNLIMSIHSGARWDLTVPLVQKLAQQAKEHGLTLHMRTGSVKSPPVPLEFFKQVGAKNLKLAIPFDRSDPNVKAAAATPEAVGILLISSLSQLERLSDAQKLPVILESASF